MTRLVATYFCRIHRALSRLRAALDRGTPPDLDYTLAELSGLLNLPPERVGPVHADRPGRPAAAAGASLVPLAPPTTSFDRVRHQVASLIDEVVIAKEYGDEKPSAAVYEFIRKWKERPLVWTTFRHNDRQTLFWQYADDDASDHDVREVTLWCVGHGFRGDLTTGAPPGVPVSQVLRNRVLRLLTQLEAGYAALAQTWPARSEDRPPARVPPLRGGRRWFPRLLAAVSGRQEQAEHVWQRAVAFYRTRGIDIPSARLYLLIGGPLPAARLLESVSLVHRDPKVIVYSPPGYARYTVVACREAAYVVWTGDRSEAPPRTPDTKTADSVTDPPPSRRFPERYQSFVRTGRDREVQADAPGVSAGLWHLCRAIARSRAPLPGVNGVLALIPWAVLGRETTADRYADGLARDLTAARDATGVSCPVATLVYGLESEPGFRPFLGRLPEVDSYRLGAGFSWLHRPGDDQVRAAVDEGLARLTAATSLRVYDRLRELHQEAADPADPLTPHAEPLAEFLVRLHDRLPALRRSLARVAGGLRGGDPDGWHMLTGCYLAATGEESRDQLFLPGVVAKLNEDRNHLAWTTGALREDERWHYLSHRVNAAVTALAVCAVAALSAFFWYSN